MERCENCGRTIGNLETANVLNDHVVCDGCRPVLAKVGNPRQVVQRTTAPASVTSISFGVFFGVVLVVAVGIFISLGISASSHSRQSSSVPKTELERNQKELMDAIIAEDMSRVKLVLQREPNFDCFDDYHHKSPLGMVIDNVDKTFTYADLYKPEDRREWQNLAEVMLAAHAPLAIPSKYYYIIRDADSEWSIGFLIKHGADVDSGADSGTPLFWKSDYTLPLAELLLTKGANPNAQNFEGQSPLHSAAQRNEKRMIDLLIRHGAKVNLRDKKGYTPLKRARLSIQKEAETELLKHGATE